MKKLLLISALCTLPSALYAAVPQSQRDALIAIYDSTGGANWTDKTNWRGPAGSECTWFGISCDEARDNVIGIELNDNNLTGSLPAAIGNFPALRWLYLYSNHLSGRLPAEIGKLANLEVLYIIRNAFSGPLPPEIGTLAKLELFYIYENQFSGSIPKEIGNLGKLRDFDAGTNQLSGAIPPELGNIATLENLSLTTNALTGTIPPELGRLSKLQSLYLPDNQLTGSIPSQLGDLASLNVLHVGYNKLTGAIPTSLGKLANLEQLYLGPNGLTGTLPKELGDLTKLQILEITDTQINGPIPRELFRATALEKLNLSTNALSGPIPREVGALKSLTTLWLFYNQLTGTLPIEITTLPKLESLGLVRNQLGGPIPPELSRVTTLRELDLSTNAFTGTIPLSLTTLPNLESLTLASNQLEGPVPPELGNLPKLAYLNLAENRLTGTIPDALRKLTQLRQLSLGGNRLTGTLPSWIGELTELVELFVGGNQLTGDLPASLANLEKLAFLELANNQLTGPLPDFSRMHSLIYLRGEVNRLSGPIPASIASTNLGTIYLADNQFSGTLPRELSKLTTLSELSLQANQLEGSFPTDLPESLTALGLSLNRFSGTLPKEIARLKNLQYLSIAYNAFRGPVPPEITQLTSLADGGSQFDFNALFTTDPNVDAFMTRKSNAEWKVWQTVKPTNVRVVSTTDRSATLTWTPIGFDYGGGGYQVVASKSPGGPAAAVSTTSAKNLDTITVRNLEPSTTYFFTVATVSHPHPAQDNLLVSDFTDAVSAATTAKVVAPPEVVVTEATNGLVQIGGVAANEDSFTLTNFGDGTASLTITRDDFFTLEADAITIAGGASRTIKVRSVQKPIGVYYGGAYVIGEGADEGIYVPVTLLSVAKPVGTVVAEPVDTRIELAGIAGSEQVGTARFRNTGTARLTGIVVADQPWVVPNPEPVTIDPGQMSTVNFKVVRERRPQSEGALTATLSLVYVDGSVITSQQTTTPSSGINISKVTIVDVTKPPVTPAQFGAPGVGEFAWFIPGVANALRGAFGSDISILNGSASRSASDLKIYFAPSSGTSSVATLQSLASNQTITLTNVVANVYNTQGTGTVQVRSGIRELGVLANMTSLRANGTFGGDMPVFRSDRSIQVNEKLYLAGLAPTTDLIVQEVGGTATGIRIELLAANGTAIGSARNESLAALGMFEWRDIAANAATAIITNTGGSRIVAYARVTDASGDAWSVVDWSRQNGYSLAEPARVPLAQRAVAPTTGPGRRRAVHSDATASTTDVTLFNPTSAAITALVEVISANGRTSSREIALDPLRTITIANAVTTTDAATAHIVVTPQGSKSAQVVVTAKSTHTAVPVVGALDGLRVGQARSFAGLDDSTSATIAAASPATFTTSYGFVESAGASVRVRARLFLEKERSVVTATVFRDFDLPARGQIVVPELVRSIAGDTRDAAYGDLHNLRLQIEVIEGKGAVVPFVIVTDNGSGDVVLRMQ